MAFSDIVSKSSKLLKLDVNYFVKNGFWLMLSQGINLLRSLILSVMFANWLPQEIFGQYKFAMSVLATAGIFSLQAMPDAVVNSVAKGKDGSYSKAISMVFKWSLLGSVVLFAVGLFGYFSGRNYGMVLFLLLGLLNPFYATCLYYRSFLLGKKNFRRISLFTISFNIISLGVLAFIISEIKTTFSIVLATVLLSVVIHGSYTLWLLLKKVGGTNYEDKDLEFGRKVSFSQGVSAIAVNFDILLLPIFLSFTDVAIYAIVTLLPNQLKTISNTFVPLFLPKLSALSSKNAHDSGGLWRQFYQLLTLSGVLIIGYIIVAPFIFKYLYPVYAEYLWLSILYSFTFLTFPSILLSTWFVKQNNIPAASRLKLYSGVFLLVGTLIFVPLFGLVGAVVNRMIHRCFNFFLSIYYFKSSKSF